MFGYPTQRGEQCLLGLRQSLLNRIEEERLVLLGSA